MMTFAVVQKGEQMSDLISRNAILKYIEKMRQGALMMDDLHRQSIIMNGMNLCEEAVRNQPSVQPDQKYEYHYDHTDCIWYRPEARNRCPTTCAQYRDGWNDAMNYIFRDGKGYRPYRRDMKYEE